MTPPPGERDESFEGVSSNLLANTSSRENVQEESQGGAEDNEASRLASLAATARNQDDLEKDIGRQADHLLLVQADERDQKRIDKTVAQRDQLSKQAKKLQQRIEQAVSTTTAIRLHSEIQHLQAQISSLDNDLAAIQKRVDERHEDASRAEGERERGGNRRMPGESRREFLIRTGKITPFSNMKEAVQPSSNLADIMLDAEDQEGESEDEDDDDDEGEEGGATMNEPRSHRNLLKPGFMDDEESSLADSTVESIDPRPRKKVRRNQQKMRRKSDASDEAQFSDDDDEYRPEGETRISSDRSDDGSEDDDYAVMVQGDEAALQKKQQRERKNRKKKVGADDDDEEEEEGERLAGIDDGDEAHYQARLRRWVDARKAARQRARARAKIKPTEDAAEQEGAQDRNDGHFAANSDDEDAEEWYQPHPTRPDAVLDDGLRIPGDIYPSLFDYQKTGVQWLSELYSQQVGGIIGDEMGLGKTIQIISFLAGLHHSERLTMPVIVVTPATVMEQWVNEFHRWWPPLRVSILHSSGSGMMNVRNERMMEDELDHRDLNSKSTSSRSSTKAAKKIVDRVLAEGHVLVTTYYGLQSYAELLISVNWGYAVLDEGHKIRNPNAAITIYCKELRTSNRIILSGTPMQNNLTELWSLFDFIFPMRLGTLVSFRQQFDIPIRQGGYANASNLQVETALQCAQTLKDAISPYLLQRFKVDVASDLPKKSEQVLFCRLTRPQREAYESFLASGEMDSIVKGKRQALYGIDILRKICNHPDLQDHRNLSRKSDRLYGSGAKSGKMQVVKSLLELWRDTGHKTLLFAQHRIMLDILEIFIKSLGAFRYLRMDGTTLIKDRQSMVDAFNRDPSVHVFLLTTKVGGLGVNLTGADRVIIYDPDWNPSTDMQARERAWRLGQKREVMIYRLMTAGTIEEKIYHRQIFKQFLTNKILRDPKQRQTFQLKDLHDLFTLGDENDAQTETGSLFKGAQVADEAEEQSEDAKKLNTIFGIAHREAYKTAHLEDAEMAAAADDQAANYTSTAIAPSTTTAATTTKSSTAVVPDTPLSTATTLIGDGTPGALKSKINDSSRIMSSLFARSGVHSTMEHESILNSSSSRGANGVVSADPVIIAREAKKIAAAAARELQRAGEEARHVPAGTPTWTGVYGIAGREDGHSSSSSFRGGSNSRRGGRGGGGSGVGDSSLASSTVLSNLSSRQSAASSSSSPFFPSTMSGNTTPLQQQQQPKGKEFITLIRDYLLAHGGAVYTQMLIDHFNRYCGTPARTAEFKEMLKTIAVLERSPSATTRGGSSRFRGRNAGGGDGGVRMLANQRAAASAGRGRWVLKREFGGTA